ncbi:YeeE/YedE thiosulfate transporter family protein [Desulfitobacterium hafniense]|uniref:YeeE/YedE thiosulfate transporter family protein n=1 Tax=Desulfitobacterium hafniense TaxID=49338 RepID=UPI0003682A91|nr:YeeE/YedE thiosulfate transporter family protein [Desulfitobacterium hafniense]
MRKELEIIYKGPWAYWVGAVVLAILNIMVLVIRQKPWGITTNIEDWSVWLGAKIGLVNNLDITLKQLLLSDGTYLNLGVILGAFWATLVASQARFRPVKDKKFVISALIGGILMGYGARIAYGCNIGLVLNGIASGSLSGWIFAIAVFMGTWLGAKLLVRFLL